MSPASPALQPFEANCFPLDPGVRLLEASAGTGKTFALAHLVLRLVTRPEAPLTLQELLVVTFTEAAAAELRDRIALRLQQALALVEGSARLPGSGAPDPEVPDPGGQQPDPVLLAWLEQQHDGQRLRGQLLLALEQLDRADITTIHGFCRRTLQRRSLEAGLGPAVELESDDGERRAQVCHDYWQQQVLPVPPALLAGLRQRGLDPQVLEKLLQRLDGDPALELDPLPAELDLEQPLAPQLDGLWPGLWERFQAEWQQRGAALEQALCAAAADLKQAGAKYDPYVLKPSGRDAQVSTWIAAQNGTVPGYAEVLDFSNSAKKSRESLLLDVFHPGPYVKATAPIEGEGRPLPQAPLLRAVAELVDGPAERLLLHFGHWGRRELARRRGRSGRMGFGQLLEGLDPGADGGQGTLIAAVAERYRVALIDEFQDTDPIQWRILERAFTAAAGEPARHLLVMVGDPKQAIYRFRGGELATYRQARERADACYGLTQNRRSSQGLVAGFNALMVPAGLRRSELAVPAVEACARKGELLLPAGEAPLQLLELDSETLPEQVAGLCLDLLQRRLLLRQPGPEGTAGRERPLEPGDLCLLVARHSQAEELRRALERRHLPSRLVSRGDVFASEGATGLQRLLDALADPGHAGRLRLLAASALLGWSAERIATAPPEAWDALADALSRLAVALPRQGLMAALGQLLRTEGLARLSLGGRALADLQQAAELAQEHMHRHGLTAAAAADWLRRLRLDPDREVPEAHQLHSAAADSSIAVVTVHRSKGLEYPVVICPYLWMAPQPPTSASRELGRRWRPRDSRAARLDLHLSPHWGVGRQAALEHQLAQEQESERLAYVAATRAQHLLVLGWRQEKKHAANPLAPWLLDTAGVLRTDLPLHRLDPTPLPAPERHWSPQAPEGALSCGPIPQHRLDTSWGRASYSSWAHSASPLPPQAAEEGRDTDALSRDSEVLALASDQAPIPPAPDASLERRGPLADFPRGAGPGEALHAILEQIDYRQESGHPGTVAVVNRELGRAGLDLALAGPLLEGLERLRLTPLGGPLGQFRLADLEQRQRLNEMNFDLPLAVPAGAGMGAASGESALRQCVTARALAEVFAAHPSGLFGTGYARALSRLEVASRGFLTGSIDLVFRCGERWWVADWKSNWLGERDASGQPLACGPAHYDQLAMAELMAANHYPLQAHLYLVALHRYLRWRMPGYAPERHLGGYAYVFLRGAPGPTTADPVPGMLVEQPPLQRLLALDQLLQEGAR
ncbi:UvrD-helicase domain-containing protein [Vulcanococcus limneticus]|uniref:UvrD-helicase domain-containing protein n=1 Tax=Vulcanococcus limneticus TaxID=2170428 RepID=UPI001E4F4358|nr:UvrD-helicase domain-containing protein [Vulcanococcus limneticus]